MPVSLVHRRWVIPILAQLHREGGSRFAALRGHLGLSRDALTSTLDYLVELDLVVRNTGHGHPLRPEYLPTTHGGAVAAMADPLHTELQNLDVLDVGLRKWSLPVVGAVANSEARFSELRTRLEPITPRALSKTISDLVDARLLHAAEQGVQLTTRCKPLVRPLRRLATAFHTVAP